MYHKRDGNAYLTRDQAFPSQGCYATVFTVENYLRHRDASEEPDPPEGTTHILLSIEVVDETTGRGNPPWAYPVADLETAPSDT